MCRHNNYLHKIVSIMVRVVSPIANRCGALVLLENNDGKEEHGA